MLRRPNPKGQSAVEFLLTAPFLFLFFFLTIQLAYTAYVAFSVQRAALSAAREISLTGPGDEESLYFKVGYALAPLASLHPAALIGISRAQCAYSFSPDRKKVLVQVRYPMPIWVPMAGKILGVPFPSGPSADSPAARALRKAFLLLGKAAPNFGSEAATPAYVRWMTFQASAVNEGFTNSTGF
jgi:hypothetical protein